MLTSILRSNTILGFLLGYLFSAALLVVPYILLDQNALTNDLLYSHWAFAWLHENVAFLPWLGLLLIALAAILSRLRTRETKPVLGDRNLLMVSFVSIIMAQPKMALTRPDVLVALILILGLFLLLMYTYKQESVLSEVFHVGLFLGVACIFVGQSVLSLLAVGFALVILRTGNWREWAVLFLGIAMVAVFIMMVTIWYESPFLAFQRVVQSAWLGSLTFGKANSGHIALLVASMVSLSGLFGSLTTGTVAERNVSLTNAGWLFAVVLMVLLLGLGWQNGIIMAAFPLSSMMARTLESITRWWLADLLLLIILSAPILSSLWPL
ncbi:MAG: hypothetical protein GC178_06620 [Flavobacteriales bacterium]|nr:hypothetical protein [Flavobacteriales bacterium]